jgi:hypothetical protein
MEQLRNFGDQRNQEWCVYCGGGGETRDHVPSRIFLDEPYPENLPIVAACRRCNAGFSLDEEYLACLLECVLAGTTEPERTSRTKIRRILTADAWLKERSFRRWANSSPISTTFCENGLIKTDSFGKRFRYLSPSAKRDFARRQDEPVREIARSYG